MSKKHLVSPEQAEELINRLYEQTSTEGPSEELDAAILAKAKQSVAKDEQGLSRIKAINWNRYGSVAATLVIAVTVGMLYQENREALIPETPIRLETHAPAETQELDTAASISGNEAKSLEKEPDKELLDQTGIKTEAGKVQPESSMQDQIGSVQEAESLAEEADRVMETTREAPAEAAPSARQMIAPKAFLKSAPEPVKKQKAKGDNLSSPDQLVLAIRQALENNQFDQAQELWRQLNEQFPDYEKPGDLVGFFGNDN